MSSLTKLDGAGVFALVSSFARRCPICSGGRCATPWCVYRRTVVDEEGLAWRILVPRFFCRRRGPKGSNERTFSVLPASVVPRRRWALTLALRVAEWCRSSLATGLDRLSELGVVAEARQLRRWLAVLGIACERLRQHPLAGVNVTTGGRRREQACELARACRDWESSANGRAGSLVMTWQGRWLHPLLDIRLSRVS